MPSRIAAFLLAILTMWSSCAVGQQQLLALLEAPAAAAAEFTEAAEKRADFNGSVGDHRLDDQPAQFEEPALDPSAPIQQSAQGTGGHPPRFACPVLAVSPQPPGPYLDERRRPPIGT